MAVAQAPSLSSPTTDPLRNFVWQVTIRSHAGVSVASGFMTVAGLGMTIDVIPYREGQHNTTTQKLPGQADFQPITMTEGVIVGQTADILAIQRLFIVAQGSGVQAPGQDFRFWLEIEVLDHPVTTASRPTKMRFVAHNAWPTSIAWSDLDAGANQLLVEQVSFAHEGIDAQLASSAGSTEANPAVWLKG